MQLIVILAATTAEDPADTRLFSMDAVSKWTRFLPVQASPFFVSFVSS
jgi:hypothetical protein